MFKSIFASLCLLLCSAVAAQDGGGFTDAEATGYLKSLYMQLLDADAAVLNQNMLAASNLARPTVDSPEHLATPSIDYMTLINSMYVTDAGCRTTLKVEPMGSGWYDVFYVQYANGPKECGKDIIVKVAKSGGRLWVDEIRSCSDTAVDDSNTVLAAEVMPEFAGGYPAMQAWLGKQLHYPAYARDNNIEGRVLVSFVVRADGEVCNPMLALSVAPCLDHEAMRVVRKMPRWKPGMKDGKPVNVRCNVPIVFKKAKAPTPVL